MRSWSVLFFYCCLWWQGNSVTLLSQCISPCRIKKWRKKAECFFSSIWWQICRFCWDLMDKRQFIPLLFSRGFRCWFHFFWFCLLYLTPLMSCCLIKRTLYPSGFLLKPILLLVLHWVSLDISKQFWGSRPSPAAYHNTALLLIVNSSAVHSWK